MICTKCKKNQATMYYEESINGIKKVMALCPECAAGEKPQPELFGGSLFGGDDLLSTFFGVPAVARKAKRCEFCGLRWSDIKAQGKVGCPTCYTTFREELEPTIYSTHGAASHMGRRPKLDGAKAETKDTKSKSKEKTPAEKTAEEILSLKEALKSAIEKEDFEEAARLRDKIRELEDSANEKLV